MVAGELEDNDKKVLQKLNWQILYANHNILDREWSCLDNFQKTIVTTSLRIRSAYAI